MTSGRLWRLYHETTSYKLDYYYEVDLPALLASGDMENFKYFYLFFRWEAFGQTVDGGCFLDRVREESVAYAQEIGEDLLENVYRAMKILAQGFLAEAVSGAPAPSQEAVARAQENSMRLLYQMLFIFYAESRSLLDTNNRYYYELSLQKLKSDVAERLDKGEPLLCVRYSYWDNLKNLFCLINDGSESRRIAREEFYIPAYNGGLFDPAKNGFLESARIEDSFLARAIDLLARSQHPQAGFVDYSSLEISHLGSIYEGLLEYRLCVAEQQMAAIKEKGKELWLPAGDAGKRKVLDRAEAGEIYLATDKGERNATGSYYAPDYIVKYIVKNTIEPVIEKKKQEWLGTSRPFADHILSIKVLDPAMGSGHFLVEATDQLARWLVQAWATARPEEAYSKEIAEQDVHWARREVVRNCIYGVDLNPMAVELAKLSLWLTTVASNKPLSFLDHHLRCGNSLIGAELDRLTVLPGGAAEQTPLWNYGLKSHTNGLLKRYSLMAALPCRTKYHRSFFHQGVPFALTLLLSLGLPCKILSYLPSIIFLSGLIPITRKAKVYFPPDKMSTPSMTSTAPINNEEVYQPAEDTYLLLRAAKSEARPETLALEIGCGSGFISQELGPKVARLLATDINPHAVRAAKARGIEVIRADLLRGIKGKFDLILFNAPYLPTEPAERTGQWIDYALDGGENGRQTVDRFIEDLALHLRPGGRALLLISSLTGLAEVQRTAKAAGLTAEVVADEGCFFERLYVLRLGTIYSSSGSGSGAT